MTLKGDVYLPLMPFVLCKLGKEVFTVNISFIS